MKEKGSSFVSQQNKLMHGRKGSQISLGLLQKAIYQINTPLKIIVSVSELSKTSEIEFLLFKCIRTQHQHSIERNYNVKYKSRTSWNTSPSPPPMERKYDCPDDNIRGSLPRMRRKKGPGCCSVVHITLCKHIFYFIWKLRSYNIKAELKGTESKLFEVQCGVSVVCDVSCCQQVLVMIDPLFLQSTCPLYPNYQMIYWQCYYSAWLFSELFWLEPYRESIKATWASKTPQRCHPHATLTQQFTIKEPQPTTESTTIVFRI